MFTLVFLTVLLGSILSVNKKNEQKTTDESLIFEGKDSLVILGCLIGSIILNFIFKNYLSNMYFISAIASSIPFAIIMAIVNGNREKRIRNKQEQILKIYEATEDMVGKKKVEEIEYDNVPFEYELDEETKEIKTIIFDMAKGDFRSGDDVYTLVTYSLNKHLAEYQWISEEKIQERQVIFHGLPKPPKIAMYPGSDYRPVTFIPLGVSGEGEVGWLKTKSPKGMGFSNFQYENGNYAKTPKTVVTPQFLACGSTGGGKSVAVVQKTILMK